MAAVKTKWLTRMKAPWSSFKSTFPLASKCLPIWLILLVPTVWVERQDGLMWDSVAAILSPLTGSFGAVVIGSIFVDRYRSQLAERQRREWVSRASEHLLTEHEAIRRILADIAIVGYAIAEPLLAESDRVPKRLLGKALKRPPYTPPEFLNEGEPLQLGLQRTFEAISDRFSEDLYHDQSGPLPWAIEQLSELSSAATGERRQAESMGLTLLKGHSFRNFDKLHLTPHWEGAGESLDVARANAASLVVLASDLGERLRDFSMLEVYQPARLELSREDSGLDTVKVLRATRSLLTHARELAQLAEGCVPNHGSGADQVESAALVEPFLEGAVGLLRDVQEISSGIREWTRELSSYSAKGDDEIAALKEFMRQMTRATNDLSREQDYRQWEHFLDGAVPIFDWLPQRPKRPATSDVIASARAGVAAGNDAWSEVRKALEGSGTNIWAELAALDALAAAELDDVDAQGRIQVAENLYANGALMAGPERSAWSIENHLARSYARIGQTDSAIAHWREFLRLTTPEIRAQASRSAEALGTMANHPSIRAINERAEDEAKAEMVRPSSERPPASDQSD